jgi:hypothetical protein
MCQRLYIASGTRLKTVEKTKDSPSFAVQDVSDDRRVRARFGPDREFLYRRRPCGVWVWLSRSRSRAGR